MTATHECGFSTLAALDDADDIARDILDVIAEYVRDGSGSAESLDDAHCDTVVGAYLASAAIAHILLKEIDERGHDLPPAHAVASVINWLVERRDSVSPLDVFAQSVEVVMGDPIAHEARARAVSQDDAN